MLCRVLMITTLVLTGGPAWALTESVVDVGAFSETNPYHVSEGARSNGFVRLAPRLDHQSRGDVFGLKAKLGGSYNKYFQYPAQDYFDYNGKLTIPMYEGRTWSLFGSGDVQKISEPAIFWNKITRPNSGKLFLPERLEKVLVGGTGGIKYKHSALSTFRTEARYQLETYDDPYYEYLNNYYFEASGYYDYQFLPETTFFVGGMFGEQLYPDGTKNKNIGERVSEQKVGSYYVEGRGGIKGRLAEKTRIEASSALQIRVYEKDSGFSEPVFNLRVEEQFTPKDLLIAGYDYEVHDSKWTNFVVDQTTYLGYARILGDQVLLLGKVGYTYSSFSKPYKREDQRLAGSFKIDYSVNPKTKISALFDIDVLSSDQLNANPLRVDDPDHAVSYENFKAGLQLTQYF